jgi:hypothetical protein
MKKSHTYLASITCILSLGLAMVALPSQSARAQTVVDVWDTVKTPPAPEIKSVTLDPKSTALLLLDFNKQTCSTDRRPRCIASIPKMEKLLTGARASGVFVVYSLSAGATPLISRVSLPPKPLIL